MLINPNAKEFFDANPEEPYWYYNDRIRVLNPRMRRELVRNPRPWKDQ